MQYLQYLINIKFNLFNINKRLWYWVNSCIYYLRNSTNRSKVNNLRVNLVVDGTWFSKFLQFTKQTLLFLFLCWQYVTLRWTAGQSAVNYKYIMMTTFYEFAEDLKLILI